MKVLRQEMNTYAPNAIIQFDVINGLLHPDIAEAAINSGYADMVNMMSYYFDSPVASRSNYLNCNFCLGQFDLFNTKANGGWDCASSKPNRSGSYAKDSRIEASKLIAGYGIWSTDDAFHKIPQRFCEELKFAVNNGLRGAEFWAINHRKPTANNSVFYQLIKAAKSGDIKSYNCSDF